MGEKTVTLNRKARHDYHILRTFEAGLSLVGSEIKSIRRGKVSIREAYVRPKGRELWLVGAHVAQYPPAAGQNHEPTRDRKLLLHRKEIRQMAYDVEAQGVTLIPLRLYLNRHVLPRHRTRLGSNAPLSPDLGRNRDLPG